MKTKKTVGLALSSGAYRGFAHIGVLKSFEKNNIPIDFLSGSSVGSWIGAYYAAYKNVEKLEADLTDNRRENLSFLFDLSWSGGFIGGRKFMAYLERNLQDYSFSDLKIPLQIVATDLVSGRPYVFRRGKVAQAVRASTSVPVVFKPYPYENKLLIDGGLSNPIPCDLLKKEGADIVIAVNLYNKNEFVEHEVTLSNIVVRSTVIALHNLAKVAVRGADVVIEPDLSAFTKENSLSKYFTKDIAQKMISIGEKAADKMMPEIKKTLSLK